MQRREGSGCEEGISQISIVANSSTLGVHPPFVGLILLFFRDLTQDLLYYKAPRGLLEGSNALALLHLFMVRHHDVQRVVSGFIIDRDLLVFSHILSKGTLALRLHGTEFGLWYPRVSSFTPRNHAGGLPIARDYHSLVVLPAHFGPVKGIEIQVVELIRPHLVSQLV